VVNKQGPNFTDSIVGYWQIGCVLAATDHTVAARQQSSVLSLGPNRA